MQVVEASKALLQGSNIHALAFLRMLGESFFLLNVSVSL